MQLHTMLPDCELGCSVLPVLTPEPPGEGLVRLPKGSRNALSRESSSIWGMEHRGSNIGRMLFTKLV